MQKHPNQHKVFLSQDLRVLAKCLSAAFQDHAEKLKKQWIFVPSVSLKQFVKLKIAEHKGGTLGFHIVTLDEMLIKTFRKMPSKEEMLGVIYSALGSIEEVQEFLKSSPDARISLAKELAPLFFSYGNYEAPKIGSWQGDLFDKVARTFSLPIHFLESAPFFDVGDLPCHFFGFSYLPPLFWSFLNKAPKAFFYLFSPCAHFWADALTDREKGRVAKNIGVDAAMNFLSAPPLLANLGGLGKLTLQEIDRLNLDVVPVYAPTQEETFLHRLQKEIVLFERIEKKQDASFQIFQTGSSKLNEIEALGEEILRLFHDENIPFSQIHVFAPDIHPYIPLIEFVFSKQNIPYRFPHICVEKTSSFYQGVCCLVDLAKGIDASKLRAFFEVSAFYKKFNLSNEQIKQWGKWVEEIFSFSGAWEEGSHMFLHHTNCIVPGSSDGLLDTDLFERLLLFLNSLPKRSNRSFHAWALVWEEIVSNCLEPDAENEKDTAAFHAFFRGIKSLKNARVDGEFPLEIVDEFLKKEENISYLGNHLHAVTCASLKEGSIMPSRAICVIGMDEESFPRKSKKTTLALMHKAPDLVEVDRFLFLQAMLQAKDKFCIFYGNISHEDGKEVPPSLVLQDVSDISFKPFESHIVPSKPVKRLYFSCSPQEIESQTVLLSDLLSFARNPWRYYLKKQGMYLEEKKETSIAALRGALRSNSLLFPIEDVLFSKKKRFPGIFEEAFQSDVEEQKLKIDRQLKKWDKQFISLGLYETAQKNEFLPLEVHLNDACIRICGNIPFCFNDGAVHFGAASLSSTIKNWPEILVCCSVLKSSKIYFLKTGKIKELENPLVDLSRFLEFYFLFSDTLCPLIPDWADGLLKKSPEEFSPDFEYEDVVNSWVYSRLEMPQTFAKDWEWIRGHFEGLISLYRRNRAKV